MGEGGQSRVFRKETTMGKEARNKRDLNLAPEVREKFEELMTLLSAHGLGLTLRSLDFESTKVALLT